MAENSAISWTTHTLNPWRGCTKVSAACANCYAETLSKRNPKVLGQWGPMGTRVVAAESMWREPVKWNREAGKTGTRPRVFCASLADVFEDWTGAMTGPDGKQLWQAGDGWTNEPGGRTLDMQHVRERLFRLIDATHNLDWLLLTKRPENIDEMMPLYGGLPRHYARRNLWLGTTVENQQAADERIPHLLKVPAVVRFLSCEPLLGPIEFSDVTKRSDAATQLGKPALNGIHWVIVGTESGSNRRPMQNSWAESIVSQCQHATVKCFMKQIEINGKVATDAARFPLELAVQDFPKSGCENAI